MSDPLLAALGPAVAVLGGLVVAGWGLACLGGRFPRNPVLGYRTRAALRSCSSAGDWP